MWVPDTTRDGRLSEDAGSGDACGSSTSIPWSASRFGLDDESIESFGRCHGAPVFGWVARPKGIWK